MNNQNEMTRSTNRALPTVYRIKVKGRLGKKWIDRIEGALFCKEINGDTSFTIEIPDQAALFGVLKRVRDSGMTLISITPS